MKKESLVVLFLLFMVILFCPAIVHAAVAAGGKAGDVSLSGLYEWFHSPDRWWN